jgi:hypothetical protein
MNAWLLLAVVVALGVAAIGVGCWRAIDRDPDPALAEHPCSEEQWSTLVAAMRSVRRRRSRARRAVRRAH